MKLNTVALLTALMIPLTAVAQTKSSRSQESHLAKRADHGTEQRESRVDLSAFRGSTLAGRDSAESGGLPPATYEHETRDPGEAMSIITAGDTP